MLKTLIVIFCAQEVDASPNAIAIYKPSSNKKTTGVCRCLIVNSCSEKHP